jgi:hypothetical protein
VSEAEGLWVIDDEDRVHWLDRGDLPGVLCRLLELCLSHEWKEVLGAHCAEEDEERGVRQSDSSDCAAANRRCGCGEQGEAGNRPPRPSAYKREFVSLTRSGQ